MASKYREILTRNFADLKRQLPIEDILCSERLLEHFGQEEIRIIKCCTTMQEKSNEFLLKLLRKPQAAFDVFMSLLLELSPPLHSQLEEGIARSRHNGHVKPRLMENPLNGVDEAGVHQVPMHRALQIHEMDTEIKEWLSGELNGTKSDRSKVIQLGKALRMDDSTMGICMRVSNPVGFLLNEYSNQNEDEANVDNLITAMNKCGLDDVSNHLLSLMNR